MTTDEERMRKYMKMASISSTTSNILQSIGNYYL